MNIQTKTGGAQNSVGEHIDIGIVTVSDRASKGEYIDEGGPKIIEFFSEIMESEWTTHSMIIP